MIAESIHMVNMSTARMAAMIPEGHVHRLPLARDVGGTLQRIQCPLSHTPPSGETAWFDLTAGVFKAYSNGQWRPVDSVDELFPKVSTPGTGTGDGVPKVGDTYVLSGEAGIVLPGGPSASRSDQSNTLRYNSETDSLEFFSSRGWISFQEANYEYEQFSLRPNDFVAASVGGATPFAINSDPVEPALTVAVLDGLRSLCWSKNLAGSTTMFLAPLYSGGPSHVTVYVKPVGAADWTQLSTAMIPESESYTSFVVEADVSGYSGLCMFAFVSDAPTLRISELVVNLQ